MPSLENLITPEPNTTLSTGVYRKSTHTDQYLKMDSHHSLTATYKVISTLTHGTKAVCSNCKKLELEHPKEVLLRYKYPKLVISRMHIRQNSENISATKKKNTTEPSIRKKYHTVISYIQGLCEKYKSTCNKHGTHKHFKGGRTLKNFLVSPEDEDTAIQKSGVIHWYKCDRVQFEEQHLGESHRMLGQNFKEHLRHPHPYMNTKIQQAT